MALISLHNKTLVFIFNLIFDYIYIYIYICMYVYIYTLYIYIYIYIKFTEKFFFESVIFRNLRIFNGSLRILQKYICKIRNITDLKKMSP